MRIVRWSALQRLEALPRSDAAEQQGIVEELPADSSELTVVFISHSWWHRPPKGPSTPDYPTSSPKAGLKHNVICKGVAALIEQEALDPATVCLWCDWWSIDQLDEARKALGVQSMIHYTTRSDYMLIPVPTAEVVNADFTDGADPDECAAYYPEDVAEYGSRGWCRVEYFIFGLFSEMRPGAVAETPLKLFAVGSSGALQQFKTVEFMGGERQDLPSQGAFSFEADRAAIASLEDRMISAFGHAVLDNFAAAGEPTVDLGAKMLRDEHLPTLARHVQAGRFRTATTLSFNACPLITTLPDLTGCDALRTLTCVNAHGLTSLPDLSGLPSLVNVKLENCDQLRALPRLPPGVEWDENHVPEHLAAEAAAVLS